MILKQRLNELSSIDAVQIGSALANVALKNLLEQCVVDATSRFIGIDVTLPDAEVAKITREIRQEIRFYEEFLMLIAEYLRNKQPQKRG